MKKTLLITALALLLMSAVSNGQAIFQPKTYQYCEATATYISSSPYLTITINYGQANVEGKEAQGDENIKFNNVAEILNYMDSQGWESISVYVVHEDRGNKGNYYHCLFRRKV